MNVQRVHLEQRGNTFHLAHIKNVRIDGRLRLCDAHGRIINATRLPMYNTAGKLGEM